MELQWGRGCVATEMGRPSIALGHWRTASMGPWLCSHGNDRRKTTRNNQNRLQWGRGCVATEIAIRCCFRDQTIAASMGPWLCSHGKAITG